MSYPASPVSHPNFNGRDGHYFESTPVSSTPTIDVSFERANEVAHPPPPPPLWPHRLSASFSAMADQIAAASQALALVPATAFSGTDLSAELGVLKTRLDGIEKTQGALMSEMDTLKTQFATLETGQSHGEPEDEGEGEGEGQVKQTASSAADAKIAELEKKLNELSEIVRLDQERLPARLHNSRATIMKASLKAPVGPNGKPAPGFPNTRGEFEHITKERYEALLKAYGQPLKGDTAAKRDTLRTFAGIPQDGQ